MKMSLHTFGIACYSWPQACSSIHSRCEDHDAILAQKCATICQQRDHAPQGCATIEDTRTNTLERHRDIHYAIIRFRHHDLLEKYKTQRQAPNQIESCPLSKRCNNQGSYLIFDRATAVRDWRDTTQRCARAGNSRWMEYIQDPAEPV